MCDWSEYPLGAWQGEPSCAVYGDHYPGIPHTLEGVLLRESACEIQYGPLNCDLVWRPDNACAPLQQKLDAELEQQHSPAQTSCPCLR